MIREASTSVGFCYVEKLFVVSAVSRIENCERKVILVIMIEASKRRSRVTKRCGPKTKFCASECKEYMYLPEV